MSEIKVDTLTGKTSAGDITVTSEGGAATMQLQQGLAKVWVNFNGTGTIATRDSLNVSSLSDNATGQFATNYSNNMNNDDYAFGGHTSNAGSNMVFHWIGDLANDCTTTKLNTRTLYPNNFTGGGAAQDPSLVTLSVNGDLA
jgi:hypothetical protein